MLKSCRCLLLFILLLFIATATAYGANYKGFRELIPDECVPLNKKAVLAQLPSEWRPYADFVKICSLKQKKAPIAQVSIITVWAEDYYEITGKSTPWKDFPRPLIVDASKKKLGELPELYPRDDTKQTTLHYGEWQSGIPTDIKVDVAVYTENEDYYYKPFLWNRKYKHYDMQGLKKQSGKRPDALDPYAFGTIYEEFAKLDPDTCAPLGKEAVLSRMPAAWRPYADFTKRCALKQENATAAKASIISIWLRNYNEAHFPAGTPQIADNPSPPLPIIVDADFHVIGHLPEAFPYVEVTDPDIYYGKWHSDMPTEILVDVYDPTVSGDRYYAPLRWNEKSRSYEQKDTKDTQGHRLR
jgi:hypothetical protein